MNELMAYPDSLAPAAAAAAPRRRRTANDSPLKYLCLVLPVGYSTTFFLAPVIFLVVLGFWIVENFQLTPAVSLANYIDISQHLFARSNYALAIAQSFYVSLTTALVAILFCYPFVLALVFAVPSRLQRLVLLLAIAPFWTSYILRVYAWQILLAKRGIINTALSAIGADDLQQGFLYTQTATRIGLVHYLAPILIVILYVTVSNIDRTLIEAARELGATRWQAFRRVILPLSSLGLTISFSFAAIISFGDVLSGSLLGGGAGKSALGSLPLFSNMIIREYASSTNLPRTSALAMILVLMLVVILLAGLAAADRAQRRMS
jgi:ABC-type spermidine/putrescine transport system permease subunit I